jgi:hypothetical protein
MKLSHPDSGRSLKALVATTPVLGAATLSPSHPGGQRVARVVASLPGLLVLLGAALPAE